MTITITTELAKDKKELDDLDLNVITETILAKKIGSTAFHFELPEQIILTPKLQGLLDSNEEDYGRITIKEIEESIDENGFINVLLTIDIEDYLETYDPQSLDSHFDIMHHLVLDIGEPMDCSDSILAVIPNIETKSNEFLILYTTYIEEFLKTEGEDIV